MRNSLFLFAAAAVAAPALLSSTDARACGGCFHGPSQTADVVTDHRMIFRITPQATTLYDEIQYQGSASSFAWVLPIKGQVSVGLSSDVVFASLDQLTVPTIQAPPLPACASCSCGDRGGATATGGGSGSSSGGAPPPSVTVIAQQTVGPYESVQLQSTDPMALTNWLSANGYSVPAALDPVVAAYVKEGFDFLALKLQPGQGVSAMRPVRVTAPGAGLQLPLRMVAAGTGATVGITLWVLADGRYEAQNFQNFTVAGSDLTWDWRANTSNYTTVRSQKEAALHNAAWQTESAFQIDPLQVYGPIQYDSADQDYLPVPGADAGADGGGGSAGETADQVRDDDLSILFPGYPNSASNMWVTRLRGDLARAALANDLMLQASSDQSQLSNVILAQNSVNAPSCPAVPNPCPPCDPGDPAGALGDAAAPSSGGGCSTVLSDNADDNVGLFMGAIALAAVVAHRTKRRS